MRILFCNDDCPGHFEALVSHFAAMPEHDVVFASTYVRRDFSLPGLRHIALKPVRRKASREGDEAVADWTRAVAAGRQAQAALQVLADSGWQPDMVLCSPGAGLPLFLDRVFPAAFRVCFAGSGLLRSLRQTDADRRTVALAVHSAVLAHSHRAFSFFPPSVLPPSLAGAFTEMRRTVDTRFFSRGAAVSFSGGEALGEEMVVVETRGSSGIGSALMVALMGLLLYRPSCHVLFLCAAPQIAEQIKEAFDGFAPSARERIHVREGLARSDLRDLLCASSAFLWPEKSPMPEEGLFSMSCGTPALAPAEAVPAALAGSVTPLPDDRDGMFGAICQVLDAPRQEARQRARLAVQEHFDREALLPDIAEGLLRECLAHGARG